MAYSFARSFSRNGLGTIDEKLRSGQHQANVYSFPYGLRAKADLRAGQRRAWWRTSPWLSLRLGSGVGSHTAVTIGVDTIVYRVQVRALTVDMAPLSPSRFGQWANTILHQSPAYAISIISNGFLTDSVVCFCWFISFRSMRWQYKVYPSAISFPQGLNVFLNRPAFHLNIE